MAFSATDLANVESAIVLLSTGAAVARLTVNGKTFEYQQSSLDQLIKLRGMIMSDVQEATSSGGRRVSTTLKSDTW
jgi:hypothetical protein